ncbi:MAG: quinone-dependent dihydroorotate dehydrogenase [Pyrinomonadaceae bacterium]
MSKFYQKLIRPLLFRLSAETAHEFGLEALRFGLATETARRMAENRWGGFSGNEIKRFGLDFKNPLGIAAGFDKNGKVARQLAALGFGFVEVGTVTFEAQKGNPKPRLFRLPEDRALINRLGFNNEGTPNVAERLLRTRPDCVLGINIGKNKDVPNEKATDNYLKSFDLAFKAADYVAVNVSSPNTPDLRKLQKSDELEKLLKALQERNRELSDREEAKKARKQSSNKPLLVKIAPDLSEGEIEQIVDICLRLDLAGIIATNTTIERRGLKTPPDRIEQIGAGGLSGHPLEGFSNQVIKKIYAFSKGELPIIGVGGIFSAEDAFRKVAAGACLLQAYTGFVYSGVGFAREINSGLARILEEKGFRNMEEAIGCEAGNSS